MLLLLVSLANYLQPIMSKKKYKKELLKTLKTLAKAEHKIIENMTNLMFLGEMKKNKIKLNEGDTFTFKESIFKYSEDKNVRKLSKLHTNALKTMTKLVDKNKFSDKELEFLA